MMGDASPQAEIREFVASDGYALKYRHYRSRGEPRGWVLAVHGIQSHSGWYEWSSSRLAAAGFDVRFVDRRGSGMNEQHRGHAESADRLCRDLSEHLEALRAERHASRRPIVVAGVSWAGKLLAAAPTLLAEAGPPGGLRCDGMALLYPAIFTRFDPHAVKRGAIRVLNRLGLQQRSIPIPLDDPQLFTDDPDWQSYIREDPATLRKVTLSFLEATLDLSEVARDLPRRRTPPIFLALAGRDEIVDAGATRRWAAEFPPERTRIVEYPGARHTLEFDACREQFADDLIRWIQSL